MGRRPTFRATVYACYALALLPWAGLAVWALFGAGSPRLGVVWLAGSLFLVSALVVGLVEWQLRRARAREFLAEFPERHPHAVMRLSKSGKLLYANPATSVLLARIGAANGDPRLLLPPGLARRLPALRLPQDRVETWTYEVGQAFVFECSIHWIAELQVFHLYVADVTERQRAAERSVHQAYHDPVTDLPNRRMFQETVHATLHAAERAAPRAAVLLIDIDRFRLVVDSLGHGVGDPLLQAVGARLSEALAAHRELAPGCVLYHFGGDLFCVLVPSYTLEETPVLLAEQILEAMRRPFYIKGRELNLAASIGISVFPLDGEDGATLLRNADAALQRAKKRGGDGLQCYTRDMNERAEEWLQLENELRHAEEKGEFRLYYHPQVEVVGGRVVGLEALLRWAHPRRGLLAPQEFLHLAEESGLITRIGEWTLRNACAQARRWCDAGLEGVFVAVNLSARQFTRETLPALVREVLRESGLDAGQLEIEITETMAMADVGRTVSLLEELKALGVRLALDDFGTGFSSLNYLKRFPIDRLKIDQSFVRHLPTDAGDAAIVRAVVTLGHSLGLTVVAEGVESEGQRAWLETVGCDAYQGYLAAPPLAAEEVPRFLAMRLPRGVPAP